MGSRLLSYEPPDGVPVYIIDDGWNAFFVICNVSQHCFFTLMENLLILSRKFGRQHDELLWNLYKFILCRFLIQWYGRPLVIALMNWLKAFLLPPPLPYLKWLVHQGDWCKKWPLKLFHIVAVVSTKVLLTSILWQSFSFVILLVHGICTTWHQHPVSNIFNFITAPSTESMFLSTTGDVPEKAFNKLVINLKGHSYIKKMYSCKHICSIVENMKVLFTENCFLRKVMML